MRSLPVVDVRMTSWLWSALPPQVVRKASLLSLAVPSGSSRICVLRPLHVNEACIHFADSDSPNVEFCCSTDFGFGGCIADETALLGRCMLTTRDAAIYVRRAAARIPLHLPAMAP
jgi:hypothetical protein